ncbi:hypothetical protein KC357_g2307 [Hortaea werneckii]|nr:hypothetical protein KC357_g2307 [Hortaea werneckii]
MSTDDFKHHALNSSHDFYELLGVAEGATDSEIRSAYRKATLKYHPDKVGANEQTLGRWHLLQVANEVLADSSVRELYDNARRARAEKKQRDEAYEGRRKWMKEDLERRESGAVKRKRDESEAEEAFERELRRIAENNKRRRKEMEAKLSEEARKAEAEEAEAQEGRQPASNGLNSEGDAAQHLGGPSDIDRTVTLRFPSSVTLDREKIVSMFSRFGNIDEALLRPPKKIRVEGEKHRKEYITAVVVFKSIVGAHAAVSDFASIQKQSHQEDAAGWRYIEQVNWASGKEPDAVPKPKSMTPQSTTPGQSTAAGTPPAQPSTTLGTPSARSRKLADDLLNRNPPETPTTPQRSGEGNGDAGLKRVPSFASFKGTPRGAAARTPMGSPSLHDVTMMRLKNAERRRLEEKIRREEAADEAGAGHENGS